MIFRFYIAEKTKKTLKIPGMFPQNFPGSFIKHFSFISRSTSSNNLLIVLVTCSYWLSLKPCKHHCKSCGYFPKFPPLDSIRQIVFAYNPRIAFHKSESRLGSDAPYKDLNTTETEIFCLLNLI